MGDSPAAPASSGLATGDSELLTLHLARSSDPCPACGYDLRGLQEASCPECGAALALGVVSDRARPGPWSFALVAFALATGFDVVVTLLLTGAMVAFGAAWELFIVVVGLSVAGLASVMGLVVVHWERMWWMRLEPAAQWRLAVGLFLLVGLGHALLGAVLMLVVGPL